MHYDKHSCVCGLRKLHQYYGGAVYDILLRKEKSIALLLCGE
jgi:hypothetical protein